jgi:hypothetical protein
MMKLPETWTILGSFDKDSSERNIPKPTDPAYINIVGVLPNEYQIKIFQIPVDTDPLVVLEVFQVGYRGVEKHGYDEEEIDRVLKSKVSMLGSKFPFVIEFASASEFKLNFKNKITGDDLLEFATIFPQDEDTTLSGLDGYCMFAEDENIFSPILEDNSFCFWWE